MRQYNDKIEQSYFTGKTLPFILIHIAAIMMTVLSAGIAVPWAKCLIYKWRNKNTVINGKRLFFSGKASVLFKEYIIWWLLSLITFGVYSFWCNFKLLKWEISHTHIEGNPNDESFFDGEFTDFIIYYSITFVFSLITLGIALPWLVTPLFKWQSHHTVIGTHRFSYNGSIKKLFRNHLKWFCFTVLTFGVYILAVPVSLMRFVTENTTDPTHSNEGFSIAKEYFVQIKKDAAHMAEIENRRQKREKSLSNHNISGGHTLRNVTETVAEVQYSLACRLKETNKEIHTEMILSLLKNSVKSGYSPALYDYSLIIMPHHPKKALEYILKSAESGYYQAQRDYMDICFENGFRKLNDYNSEYMADLKTANYWYDILCANNLPLSEKDSENYKRSKALTDNISSEENRSSENPAEKRFYINKAVTIVSAIFCYTIILSLLMTVITFLKNRDQENIEAGALLNGKHYIIKGEWEAYYKTDTDVGMKFYFKDDGSYILNTYSLSDGTIYHTEFGNYELTSTAMIIQKKAYAQRSRIISVQSSGCVFYIDYSKDKIVFNSLKSNCNKELKNYFTDLSYLEKD